MKTPLSVLFLAAQIIFMVSSCHRSQNVTVTKTGDFAAVAAFPPARGDSRACLNPQAAARPAEKLCCPLRPGPSAHLFM